MSEADRIRCPNCSTKLKSKSGQLAGRTIRCPKCAHTFAAESAAGESAAGDARAAPRDAPERPAQNTRPGQSERRPQKEHRGQHDAGEPDELHGGEDSFLAGLDAIDVAIDEDYGPQVEVFRRAPVSGRKTAAAEKSPAPDRRPEKAKKKRKRREGGFAQATWPLFGLLGGIAASALWVLVANNTRHLAGYVGWLVGLFVGLGIRFAAGPRDGWAPGLTAVGTAAFCLLGAKLVVACLVAQPFNDFDMGGEVNDRTMILKIAHDVAQNFEKKHIPIQWPRGILPSEARTPEDYPDEVWDEAQLQWDNMSPADQKAAKDVAEGLLHPFAGYAVFLVFASGFNLADILWFVLALFTAFKIGSGATD